MQRSHHRRLNSECTLSLLIRSPISFSGFLSCKWFLSNAHLYFQSLLWDPNPQLDACTRHCWAHRYLPPKHRSTALPRRGRGAWPAGQWDVSSEDRRRHWGRGKPLPPSPPPANRGQSHGTLAARVTEWLQEGQWTWGSCHSQRTLRARNTFPLGCAPVIPGTGCYHTTAGPFLTRRTSVVSLPRAPKILHLLLQKPMRPTHLLLRVTPGILGSAPLLRIPRPGWTNYTEAVWWICIDGDESQARVKWI